MELFNLKNQQITINSRKFDNTIHKSWKAELLEETESYWLFVGVFENEITHSELGIIRRGTISYEYYQKQNWFNVFRFHEPEGALKLFYCNVNLPPKFENNILNYVDLDLDILVQPDFTFEILDVAEFEQNSVRFNYPEYVKSNAQKIIDELVEMIQKKSFPFDYSVSL